MPFCEPYKTDLIEEFCLTYEGLPIISRPFSQESGCFLMGDLYLYIKVFRRKVPNFLKVLR